MKVLIILLTLIVSGISFTQTLSFRENKGQYPENVLAQVQHAAFKTNILSNGFSVEARSNKNRSNLMKLFFLNSNVSNQIEKRKPLAHFSNYYLDSKLIKNVKDFQELQVSEIYKGIDWLVYEKNNVLEYDFIVKPGANYKEIKIQIEADTVHLDQDGNLHIRFGENEVLHLAPYVYQENKEILSAWEIFDNKTIGFKLGSFDPSKKLIIDPIALEWYKEFQYFESTKINSSFVDENDNVYLVGTTETDITGVTDMFLTKKDGEGVTTMNVFIGGNRSEEGHGIAIDSQGNIFISGSKKDISTDINAYILKLSPTGDILWEETFGQDQMGSDLYDYAYRLDIDSLDNLYVSGITRSNAISTPGAFQESMSSNKNVFLAKYNSSNELLWRTYVPLDFFADFECDNAGFCYVYGRNGGTTLTVLKYSKDGNLIWNLGNQLAYATSEYIASISVSPNGEKICFVGSTNTNMSEFTTAGVHQTSNNGMWDGIITVIDTSGSTIWASYFGGENVDYILGSSISNSGELIVVGATFSTTGIATEGSYSVSFSNDGNGFADAFFVKFDATVNRMFSSYYNGTGWVGHEVGVTCNFSSNPEAYFVGVNAHVGQAELLKFKESGLNTLQHEKQSFFTFKNQGEYFIQSNSKIGNFSLVDQTGKVIYSQYIETSSGKLEVDNLLSGIYFLVFENTMKSLKIVVD